MSDLENHLKAALEEARYHDLRTYQFIVWALAELGRTEAKE